MNKKLLCTAVGATLALGTGVASAENYPEPWAIAPYVVKDTNRTTVVSVIFDDSLEFVGNIFGITDESAHLQYWHKSTTAAHTDKCVSSSVEFPVTPNDIISFDTAGLFGGPLFNDVSNGGAHDLAIGGGNGQHGYLLVEAPLVANSGASLIRALYWLELDLGNGGAHGDMGPLLSSTNLAHGVSADLSSRWVLQPTTINNGVADLDNATPVVLFPTTVGQAWTVTPLGKDMLNVENNQVSVQMFKSDGRQGAFDRNENEVDGVDPVGVRCVAKIPASTMLGRVYTRASWADEGGWAFLANLGNGDKTCDYCGDGTTGVDLDAIVYQIDSGRVRGSFMTNATRIPTEQE